MLILTRVNVIIFGFIEKICWKIELIKSECHIISGFIENICWEVELILKILSS